MFNAGKNEVW